MNKYKQNLSNKMNNKIKEKFEELSRKNEMALIIGVVPGYPDLKTSFEIIKTIKNSGADILELSASFSDPVADGPTLTQAHQKFLTQKITKSQMFKFYKKINNAFDIPTFIIEYANIIYKSKPNKYFYELRRSGINNIVIPDISLEELNLFNKTTNENYVNQSLIISPISPEKRIKKNLETSKDFIYAVSVIGVTGERKSIEPQTITFLKDVKKRTKLPIIVGFGINNTEQIKTLASCDINGVIVCSAIINLINKNLDNKKIMLCKLENYIKELKKATI